MGTELGAMAAGVCLRAGLEGEFPLVLAGSLFAKAESPLLADAALLRIHRAAPGAQLRHLSGHPVYGALAEAGRLATSLK
ncbi:hypothetical protein MASR2M78_21170 [Treponema sp.]